MYSDIKGKIAIVTGAADGIGSGIVTQLLESGATVILNDINEGSIKKYIQNLSETNASNCLPFAGNIGDLSIIKGLIEFAIQKFGKIDLLIANAGFTLFKNFFDISNLDFDKIININIKSTFFLVQNVSKLMREKNIFGKIVIMSSNVGTTPYPDLALYSMTKAALQMMVKSLVLDLAPLEIQINGIAPGATLTSRTQNEGDDYLKVWNTLIPRGKVATIEDISNTCLFLLSEHSNHITGQTIVVDGGWSSIGKYPIDLKKEA